MPKVSKKKAAEIYDQLSDNDVNRMLTLRNNPGDAVAIRGVRPQKPLTAGLVDAHWEHLTAIGKAVLSYHDSL